MQKYVEKPVIYIITQSAASVSASLRFSQTKQEDYKRLHENVTTSTGQKSYDILRVSAVDGPEQQLKCGHQLGGTYKCPCGVSTKDHGNLVHCFRRKEETLEEKRLKITEGYICGRRAL